MIEIIRNIIISIIIIPTFILILRFICTNKKEREFKKQMKKRWNKKPRSEKIIDDL